MANSSFHIRPIQVLDAEAVLDWENNVPDWNMEDNEVPYSILDILNLINELQDVKSAGQARWMICIDDRLIGVVDLTEIDFQMKTASVGVLIADKSYRRKGYAKKALDCLENEAKLLEVERLIATVLPTNTTSVHLFEKCGFNIFGKSDDKYLVDGEYIQALLFEKWLKK